MHSSADAQLLVVASKVTTAAYQSTVFLLKEEGYAGLGCCTGGVGIAVGALA